MSCAHAVLPAPPPLVGEQRPRVMSLPQGIASTAAGEDATELAAANGLLLDEWQEFVLVNAMGENDEGKWAAFEVALIISRQNGKNGDLLARELAGLYLLDESLIIHTAHEFKAAEEHFRKIAELIKGSGQLSRRVKRFTESHGNEGIELLPKPTLITGSSGRQIRRSVKPRLRFLARSKGSGRSFTCDLLVWDEAMILPEAQVGAAMPTLSAVRNPQVWYTGSAGDKESVVLGRVRRRGLSGRDPSLAFFEWSIDACGGDCAKGCAEHDSPKDPRSWARANPGMGIRISAEHVAREMASMSPNGVRVWPPDVFARERLGVGDWPVDEEAWSVIPEESWAACLDPDSPRPNPRIAIAADATPDGLMAAIGVSGLRDDGRVVIEIPEGDHRAGMTWVVPRLKELKAKHRPCAIVIDPRGPAAPLIDEAEKAGLEIVKPVTAEVAQAFGQFRKDATSRPPKLVHTGQEMLRTALAGAESRVIGDGAQAWARKATDVDICPLVAVTMAAWASQKFGRPYDPLKSVAGPS